MAESNIVSAEAAQAAQASTTLPIVTETTVTVPVLAELEKENGVTPPSPDDASPNATETIDAVAAAPTDAQRHQAKIGQLLETQRIDLDQIDLVKDLSSGELEMVSFLLEKQAVPKDKLAEFLQLPADQQQERYTKEIIIDQMIKDELFEEKDRDRLRQKELKSLQMSFGDRQANALADQDSAINKDRPSNTLPNASDMENGLTWQDVSKDPEVAKTFLAWTGKDGLIDQAIGEMVEARIKQQLGAELAQEAEQASQNMNVIDNLEELEARKLITPNGELLSKEDFIKAYIAQQLDNPAYVGDRDQRIQELVQKEVDEARGRIQAANAEEALKTLLDKLNLSEQDRAVLERVGNALKAMPALLREQLGIAKDQAVDQLFSNDWMTFLNLLINADSAYRNYRAIGTAATEEGEQVRVIGKENFEHALEYPESFGKALTQVYQKKEFVEAGFRVDNLEVFNASATGDSAAIREIMEDMLEQLFDDEGPKMEARWKAARRYLPEAIFPGVNARFDDKMKEYLQNLHKDQAAFDKAFPKTSVATKTAS